MKPKKKSKVPNRRFLLGMIKDIKDGRIESQRRVDEFNRELTENLNREKVLINELCQVQASIRENSHLIRMYKVSDEHKIYDLYHLLFAIGETDKKFRDWKDEYEQKPEGKPMKT